VKPRTRLMRMSASVHHQSVAMQKLLLQFLHFTIFAFKVRMVRLFSVTVRWRLRPMQLQVEHPCWKDWSLQRVHLSHHWLLGRSHPQSCLCHMRIFFAVRMCCMNSMCFMYPSCAQVPHAGSNPNAQMDPSCLRLSFLLSKAFIIIPSPTSLLLCSEKCQKRWQKDIKRLQSASCSASCCFMLLYWVSRGARLVFARVCTVLAEGATAQQPAALDQMV